MIYPIEYEQGMCDWRMGLVPDDNPFEFKTRSYHLWLLGWTHSNKSWNQYVNNVEKHLKEN